MQYQNLFLNHNQILHVYQYLVFNMKSIPLFHLFDCSSLNGLDYLLCTVYPWTKPEDTMLGIIWEVSEVNGTGDSNEGTRYEQDSAVLTHYCRGIMAVPKPIFCTARKYTIYSIATLFYIYVYCVHTLSILQDKIEVVLAWANVETGTKNYRQL